MGRVARYKKIKSFDPFSRQNGGNIEYDAVGVWGLGSDGRKHKKRSKTSERLRAQRKGKKYKGPNEDRAFDIPPSTKDDFDVRDLVGSLKKEKQPRVTASAKKRESFGDDEEFSKLEEREEKKLSRVVQQQMKKQVESSRLKKIVVSEGRMEGESKKAFNRRVASETRQIIKRDKMEAHNPEKKKRKKEYLDNKKKKKKLKRKAVGASEGERTGDAREDDDGYTQSDDYVMFGEQAERPPVFRHLPRKAAIKKIKPTDTPRSNVPMTEEQISAEQDAMEVVRRKAQAQYALIKAQRKRAGEFHL